MLDFVKNLLIAEPDQSEPEGDQDPLHLATACLLLEVSRADHDISEAERAAIHRVLREAFELDESRLAALSERAEREVDASISFYPFTRLINDHCSAEDKSRLVECLWRVAFADAELDKYEDHIIRTLAELIHVPHSEFIRTKLRVSDKLRVHEGPQSSGASQSSGSSE